jgi:hypothetical protein
MSHVHHEWLAKVTRDIAADYERLHAEALHDVQKAGHGGEGTWRDFLQEWLPPAYEVVTRKYIIPERGDEAFEMDLVVLRPAYPERLRDRVDILAGGVAAAFSVKLTLDAEGVRDAVTKAAQLRRVLQPRASRTARSELVGAFAVGVLAHSHAWKRPGSTPLANLTRACWDLDHEIAEHPRESLDYLCVADLAAMGRARLSLAPGTPELRVPTEPPRHHVTGCCATAFTVPSAASTPPPVAAFITFLLERLSYDDPGIQPFAAGLHATGTVGMAGAPTRLWRYEDVFTEHVALELVTGALERGGVEWQRSYH